MSEPVQWLESAHVGLTRRRTTVGVGYLGALLAGLLLAVTVPEFVLTDDTGRFALWLFNGFTATVLFSLLLSIPLGILYGLWNGGPALAGLISMTPAIVAVLLAGQLTVTVDVTLGLAGAAAATGVATVRTWAHIATRGVAKAPQPDHPSAITVGVTSCAVAVVLGVVSLGRLARSAGPHLTTSRWVAVTALVVAACSLVVVGYFSSSTERLSEMTVRDRH